MNKIILSSNYLGHRSIDVYNNFYLLLEEYALFPDVIDLIEPLKNKASTFDQEAKILYNFDKDNADTTIYLKKKANIKYIAGISFRQPHLYRLGKFKTIHNSIFVEFTMKENNLIGKENFFITLSKKIHTIFSSDSTYMSILYAPCSNYLSFQPVEAMTIQFLTILGKRYVDYFGGNKVFQNLDLNICNCEMLGTSIVLNCANTFYDIKEDFYPKRINQIRNYLDPNNKKIVDQFYEYDLGEEPKIETPFI